MKTYNDLLKTEKYFVDTIEDEARILLNENLSGSQYVRIFMYMGAVDQFLSTGEVEEELCGAHFFTSNQWNDIDQSNQVELFSFSQEKDCTEVSEIWGKEAMNQILANIIAYISENKSTWAEKEILAISANLHDTITLPILEENGFTIEATAEWEPEYQCSRIGTIEASAEAKKSLVLEDNPGNTLWHWTSFERAMRLIDNVIMLSEVVFIATENKDTVISYKGDNDLESTLFYFANEEQKEADCLKTFVNSKEYLGTLTRMLTVDIEKIYPLVAKDEDTTDELLKRCIASCLDSGSDFDDFERLIDETLEGCAKPIFYIPGGFQSAIQKAKDWGEVKIFEVKYSDIAKNARCNGQLMFTNYAWHETRETLENELKQWVEGHAGKDCEYSINYEEVDFIEEIN